MGCSDFELLKRVRHVEPARDGLQQVASSHSSSSAQPGLLGAGMPYLIPEVCYCCMLSLGLHQALLNERMAPEILHYKEELVERVKAGLKRQVRALLACASPACAAVVMSVSSTVAAAPIACVAIVFTSTCSKCLQQLLFGTLLSIKWARSLSCKPSTDRMHAKHNSVKGGSTYNR
jgi:hypothetical protein